MSTSLIFYCVCVCIKNIISESMCQIYHVLFCQKQIKIDVNISLFVYTKSAICFLILRKGLNTIINARDNCIH